MGNSKANGVKLLALALSMVLVVSASVIPMSGLAGTTEAHQPAAPVLDSGVANFVEGESPPVRHDSSLFVTTDSVGDRKLGSSDDLVFGTNHSTLEAYDSAGSLIWSDDLGDDDSSEPISDGDIVAVAVEDDLRVYDAADGEPLWNSASTTGLPVDYGVSVVLGDHVYVSSFEGSTGTTVYAYHRENGSVAWHNEIGGDPISLGGGEEALVVEQEGNVTRLNTSTGEVEWDRSDWPLADSASASPVIGDHAVYAVTENLAYAFNLTTGVPEWRTPLNDDVEAQPLVVDGSVYVASGQTVHELDPETGGEQVRYRTNGTVEDLAYHDGTLYVSSEDGYLYALDASLDLVWKHDIPPVTGNVDDDGWAYALTTTNEAIGAMVATHESLGDGPDYHSLSLFRSTNASVIDVQVDPTAANPGDTITATATVSNDGTESGEFEVSFEVTSPFTPAQPDRIVETVTVPAESTVDVSTEFMVNTTGEYNVTAVEAGTGGLAQPVRPDDAIVTVSYDQPNHDWGHERFDVGGSGWSPQTNASAGPIEPTWQLEPNSTSETYDEPVVVEDGFGITHNETRVVAFDIETGEVQWEYEPTTQYEEDQDTVQIHRAAVADGTIYFTMDYYNGTVSILNHLSRVYALDATSGAAVWGEEGDPDPYVELEDRQFNRDVLLVDGGNVLIETFDNSFHNLTEINANDGSVGSVHDREGASEIDQIRMVGTHVVYNANDTLISLDGSLTKESSREFNEALIRYAGIDGRIYAATDPANETDDGEVYALDPENLDSEDWSTSPEGLNSQAARYEAVAVTSELVVAGTDHRVFAFDRETGDIVWERDLFDSADGIHELAAADGVLYATGGDGTLVYELDTGEWLSYNEFSTTYLTATDNTIFRSIDDFVYAHERSGPPEIDSVALSNSTPDVDDTVWLNASVTNPYDHQLDDLRLDLYVDDNDEEDVSFALDSGETKTVSVSYVVDDEGDWNFHVRAVNDALIPQPSDALRESVSERRSLTVAQYETIEAESLDGVIALNPRLESNQVFVGDTVNLTVDLVNLGDSEAERTLVVEPDSSDVEEVTKTFTVSAGATETVQLPLLADDMDEDVGVLLDGTEIGTLDVLDDTVEIDVDAGDNDVEVGTTVPIDVELSNEGNVDNETTVELFVDGEMVGSESVLVEAETDRTVQFAYTVEEEREYVFTAGSEEETVTVGGAADIQVNTVRDEVDEIEVGVPVTFLVEGENSEVVAGDVPLELEIDGDIVTTEEVFVPGKSFEEDSPEEFQEGLNWTFDDPGEYEVSVNGVGHQGGTVTAVESVTAAFTHDPETPTVNETVTFDASNSSSPDGDIDEYRWNLTGDDQVDETTDNPVTTHTYQAAGEYDVTLTAENATGATDSTTRTVTVEGLPPSFEIDAVDSNEPVVEGDPFEVTATVENTGGQGEETVELYIEGSQADSTTLTLDTDESSTVNFEVPTGDIDAGESTFTIQTEADTVDGTFNVTEQDNGDDTPSDDAPSSSSSSSSPPTVTIGVSALLEGGETSVDLDEDVSQLLVTFSDDDASGTVAVEPLDERPDSAAPIPDATGIAFVDVTVPSSLTDAQASLQLTVSADAIGDADPSDLVVYHYEDDAWTALETTVVSTEGGEIVLEATTPGFSVFAIGSTAQQPTPDDGTPTDEEPAPDTPQLTATPAPSPTAPSTATETSTATESDGQPGFGLLVTLLALALVALVRRRRG